MSPPSRSSTVSVDQLVVALARVTHAMPIAFTAVTDTRARKTGNPFGVIMKLSRVQAFTGQSHEASVQRQQAREGADHPDFQEQERSWGDRVSPALVVLRGKWYLVTQVLRAAKPIYLVKRKPEHRYWSPIPKEKIERFLPPDRTAEVAAAQGVDKAVVYRNYALDSLRELSLNKQQYRIRHSPGLPVAPISALIIEQVRAQAVQAQRAAVAGRA